MNKLSGFKEDWYLWQEKIMKSDSEANGFRG
jgi:hypothetical protein